MTSTHSDTPRTNAHGQLRIAIDAHAIGTQLAGNATYVANLIEALGEIDTRNSYTIYVTKRSAIEQFGDRWANFTVRRIFPHTPLIRVPVTLAARLRIDPVDILHVQFTAPPFSRCKVVAAIHDISYEHFPETFDRRSRIQMKATIRATAKRADHVIAPSEYSRRDLIETYKISPAKITSIPLAASSHYCPVTDPVEIERVRRKYGLDGDFLLGVGSIQPRKNLTRLIEAHSLLAHKRGDVPPLVLVGKKAWIFRETLRSAALASGPVVFPGFVPDEDLPALYSAALCSIYPSFFEGFGLPPLEAMQCGTPVITGNLTSLPEVVGDAALTVDPYDTRAIASALERVITNENLRAEMRTKGFEQAKKFSWIETARQTLKIYERVMNRPRP